MQERSFDPAHERYVSLATYRRDGREVRTPVWMAGLDGRVYMFSAGAAGKVKRIRANGRVALAACDFHGRVSTDWRAGRGRVIEDPGLVERVYEALRDKYGWQMRAGDFFARLSGRFARRAIIEIELQPGAG